MTDFLGGGLIFGVAAVLWVVYLIPSWMRRRNFIAAESNAVRMQQTIRALVETQDSPTEVDAEISSRGLHAQRRKLHEAEVAARAKLRAAHEAAQEKRAREELSPQQTYAITKHRIRTLRVISLISFLVALLITAAGVALMMYTGAPLLILIGVGALALGLLSFRVLAASARRAKAQLARAPRVTSSSRASESTASVIQSTDRSWSPTQLPEALHLKPGSLAAGTIAASDAAARLRRAALEEAYRAQTENQQPVRLPVAGGGRAPQSDAHEAAVRQSDAEASRAKASVEGWNLDDIYRRRAAG